MIPFWGAWVMLMWYITGIGAVSLMMAYEDRGASQPKTWGDVVLVLLWGLFGPLSLLMLCFVLIIGELQRAAFWNRPIFPRRAGL